MFRICFLAFSFLFLQCSPKLTSGTSDTLPEVFLNILIDDARDGIGPCEPSIAINPINPKNIVAGAILDRLYVSHDGGMTWNKETLRSSSGVFGDPVLAASPGGTFYYAHLSDPSGKGWSDPRLLDRIVVQRSMDDGRTWNDGTFPKVRHPRDQDKQWLHIDPSSRDIFMTWTEFDLYGSRNPMDKSRILFSKSTDNADSWSIPVAINQKDGDCLDDDMTVEGAVPASGPDGEIYVAWAFNEKIYFDRSVDGGKAWLDEDLVVADQPGGWNFDVPGIYRTNGLPVTVCDLSRSIYRGTIYVSWTDQRNGESDTDVWISKSVDRGDTWSPPMRINDDGPGRHQFFSWLTIDQTTGHLYVVFYDRRNYNDEKTDVYLAVSKNGGDTFQNIKISESPFKPSSGVFFGDYNHISAHNGVIRPIWTRADKTALSVWTAIISTAEEE